MGRLSRRSALLLTLAVLAAIAGALVCGESADLLRAVPALLLFAPLLAGRFVGERQLRRIAERLRPRRVRPRRCAASLGRRGLAVAVSRGLVLAERLAGRAPPALAVTVR